MKIMTKSISYDVLSKQQYAGVMCGNIGVIF